MAFIKSIQRTLLLLFLSEPYENHLITALRLSNGFHCLEVLMVKWKQTKAFSFSFPIGPSCPRIT